MIRSPNHLGGYKVKCDAESPKPIELQRTKREWYARLLYFGAEL